MPRFRPIHRLVLQYRFCTTAPKMTNDHEGICGHTLRLLKELRVHYPSSCLHSISSNIDIKIIRPSNSSGSHCMRLISFCCCESWKDSPYKFRLSTIDTIQIFKEVILAVPFNFLPPSFICCTWIVYFTLTEYWIREDVDFGRNYPFNSFGHKAHRSPCKISILH